MQRSHLLILFFVWLGGVFVGFYNELIFPHLLAYGQTNNLVLHPILGLKPSIFGFFLNNLVVGIIMTVSGWLTAGVLSCVISFWNAFLIGVILKAAIVMGIGYDVIFQKIAWHGSFEILGLLIFGAMGLKGLNLVRAFLFNTPFESQFKKLLCSALLGTGLLFIAALIENTVI
jgi:uncharacterized membrane protein SpoIIM required for sporulation